MLLGKAVRLERIFNRNTHRAIIVPMDHGVNRRPHLRDSSTCATTVNQVAEGGANAVLMHKGLVRCSHRGARPRRGAHHPPLGLHHPLALCPTPRPWWAPWRTRIKLGADGVSLHINLGDETERHMLEDIWGAIASSRHGLGRARAGHGLRPGPQGEGRVRPRRWWPTAPGWAWSWARTWSRCPTQATWRPFRQGLRGLLHPGGHRRRPQGGATCATCSSPGPRLHPGRRLGPVHRPQHLPAPAAARIVQALHGIVHLDWEVDQALELLKD